MYTNSESISYLHFVSCLCIDNSLELAIYLSMTKKLTCFLSEMLVWILCISRINLYLLLQQKIIKIY